MRAALAVALAGLAGCDSVFGLDREDPASSCRSPDDPLFHDEDGDTLDDACDNCPTVANTSQTDQLEVDRGMLADGVGDACDPDPYVGGNTLVDVETFARDTKQARWMRQGGDWHFDTENLIYGDTMPNDYSYMIDRMPLDLQPPFTMLVQMRLDSIPDPGGFGVFEVMVDFTEPGAGPKAIGCGVYRYFNNPFTSDGVRIINDYMNQQSGGTDLSSPPVLGEYTLAFTFRVGDTSRCDLSSAAGSTGSASANITTRVPGALGFLGYGTTATVHSLAIYK